VVPGTGVVRIVISTSVAVNELFPFASVLVVPELRLGKSKHCCHLHRSTRQIEVEASWIGDRQGIVASIAYMFHCCGSMTRAAEAKHGSGDISVPS